MRGAKELDGRRVRLLRDVKTVGGERFAGGTTGMFRKAGVVRCVFKSSDGRVLQAGHMNREDFEIVERPAEVPTEERCER